MHGWRLLHYAASGAFLFVAGLSLVACSNGTNRSGNSSSGFSGGQSSSGSATSGQSPGASPSGSGSTQSGTGQPTSGSLQASSGVGASGQPAADASVDATIDASMIVDSGPPPPDPVVILSNASIKLEVWTPRTIRVIYGNGTSTPAAPPSLAVNQVRNTPPFTVDDGTSVLTVTTNQLQAQVDKSTGQVTFKTPAGVSIFAESASKPHQVNQTPVAANSYQTVGTFSPNLGEHYYGLGEHQSEQQANLAYGNGTIQLLQQNPGESSVPLLLSSGGYGVFWDNPSVTKFNFGGGGLSVQSEVGSFVDYYFMVGKPDDVVASYRAITGPAPMYGRWVFGYWQSHDHYSSQNEVLSTAMTYRSKQIPIDNIVQDWQYWGGNPWGSHIFDSSYPDPAGMFSTLHQQGFHAMISVWGRFQPGSANFTALQADGDLMTPALSDGQTYYYDSFKPSARTLYFDQMNTALFSKGVDAWWLDATEPELNASWGEFRTFTTAMGAGAVVYNAYPLMTTTAVHDGQRAASSDKRVFILTRSAYAGQQRNGAATWSGDITGDWPTFARQIPGGLNFALSGMPYWTTDIGGYFMGLGGFGNPAYNELFTRWFQFGGFCPIFRTHGTGPDRDIYASGFDAPTQAILQGVDNLRYRLLPYIYSLGWMTTSQAYTMMRALVFDFGSDAMALTVSDQYMFGPAFLVNPVMSAGATSRSVYLPADASWVDFWTGATQAGGQTVTAAAPADHLPLYVRAGSIVPMGPIMNYSTEMPADPIELRVYPGASGSFALYEDENDNYDYEKGTYATIPFAWDDASKTLHIGAVQGSFPGMLASRTFNVVFVGNDHGAGIAPSATIDKTVTYTGAATDVTAP
jgi:alpha-D-xyloside xylohydrolase